MESIERLRTYARGYELYVNHKLLDIADAIEQEVEERYMPYPLDADGKPIHVGDVIEFGDVVTVQHLELWGGAWVAVVEYEPGRFARWSPEACRHHRAPTVEDVLREVVTLCHNTWKEGSAFHFYDVDDVMESGNIAEFAAKLRLAGDE